MKIMLPALFTAALLLPTYASANEAGLGFVRAEAAQSRLEIENTGGRDENDDTGFSLRGGYYFTPNLAVEAFASRYGEDSQTIDSLNFSSTTRTRLDGFGIGIHAKKNFSDDDLGFYASLRGGAVRLTGKVDGEFCDKLTGECESFGESDSSIKPYYGIGVGYDFSPSFGIGLAYDRTEGEFDVAGSDTDVSADTLGLGLEYRF